MPVKTRARAATRARAHRLPTQFGELETTPTSHHHHADRPPAGQSHEPSTPRRQGTVAERYDDGFDGLDSAALPSASLENRHSSFQWSETESLARRSSPLHPGETPMAAWQFDDDESLPPLSTPGSGRDKLPDTAPLPAMESERGAASTNGVDFSETASTTRRSSPIVLGDSIMDLFDFGDESASAPTAAPRLEERSRVQQPQPSHSHAHLPIDNIYDATPSPTKPSAQRGHERETSLPDAGQSFSAQLPHRATDKPGEPIAQDDDSSAPPPSRSHDLVQSQTKCVPKPPPLPAGHTGVTTQIGNPPLEAATTLDDKRKRPKQRPKPPLQFDDISQQLMEPQIRPKTKPQPRSKAEVPEKPRMPIVSALRDSAQPLSPQVTVSRKRGAGKCSQPKKRAKTAAAKKQQRTPLASTAKQNPDPGMLSIPPKQQMKRVK